MSFRVYCYHCKSQLTPPIWVVGSTTFCNPQCQKDAIETKKNKELEELNHRRHKVKQDFSEE